LLDNGGSGGRYLPTIRTIGGVFLHLSTTPAMKKYFFILSLSFLFAWVGKAQSIPSAEAVIKEGRTEAAKENKKLIVIFHASWCGWCRKMDSSLNDPSVKDFFDKNYVITHLTVFESKDKKNLENPGAEELNKKWGGENQGIPFWVIMGKDGRILADSQMEPGKNVGCPASAEEVAYFIKVLKKTSLINDKQTAAVERRFRRNE
jgi:thioredoxin-related protein